MAANSSGDDITQHAPRYPVPNKNIVTIEHPFVVKNVDKAVSMLGGPETMGDAIKAGRPLSLSFDPQDPDARRITSLTALSDNVLLRITAPKRIGKRKRGSNDAFSPIEEQDPVTRDSKHLLRSMRDNQTRTTVNAVGNIQRTHVWRAMPDFHYSNQGSRLLSELKSKVLPQRYDLLQQWKLDQTMGSTDTEVAPLPTLSNLCLPQPYNFYQRSSNGDGDGLKVDREIAQPGSRRTATGTVTCTGSEPFPAVMPENMPKLEHQTRNLQNLVARLRTLFAERPIWTKRALANNLPGGFSDSTKVAIRYAGFAIRSGAWCNTHCAFGVDPRTDVQYRKYQTITIISEKKNQGHEDTPSDLDLPAQSDGRSHFFTGRGPFIDDGHTYQLCDLEDPQLKSMVNVDESQLSKKCDPEVFGWYGNGTFTKIRVVLRTKLHAIRDRKPAPDSDFTLLLTFPDHYYPGGKNPDPAGGPEQGHMPLGSSRRLKALAASYRQGCSNNGRMKFSDDVEENSSDVADEDLGDDEESQQNSASMSDEVQ